MRSGGYTLQHSLTSEAATIVKQALTLARRRGHAQVTPLHVASAMLTSSAGLLRKACLQSQSHSHPLQCKALELCFNVALNRLPTSQSSPILGPHSHYPSLSNALVAAFKRAQAHQRRGSIENQQQPILALKVEIEQLIISILDDPSVSRVMREAGFSSTQVKNNVEQSISMEICSQSPAVSTCHSKEITKPLVFGTKPTAKVTNEDVMSLLDTMMNRKRKNTVVIGECLASAEGIVRGVIDRFENGNNIPGDLRFVQFVSLPLYSLNHLSREDVEEKVRELRSLVKSYVGSRGVVLYLGDLKWVSDFWSNHGQQRMNYYSPVEHMIMELSRLMFGVGDSGKLWLMGIATFQTYMRCKSGHPSLETLWDLYPLTIPGGSLDLSLNLERDSKDQFRSITSNTLNNESTTTSTSTSLPSWLHQYKEENKRRSINYQEYDKVGNLYSKLNSNSKHPHFLETAFHFSSSPSGSMSSYNQHSPKMHQSLLNWPVIFEPNRSPKEHQFFVSESEGGEVFEPNFKTFIPTTKPDLLSNPNSSPNSASSSEVSEDMECMPRFKEVNSENLEILCNALGKRVPWQSGVIPEIANTILQCRSGMMTRKGKEETWLFFLGVDNKGKEKIAKELAKVVFGSKSNFIPIGLSSFSSSTKADSTDQEFSNKRARDEQGRSYLERFADAVQENPSRVFFMEDVEQVDFHSQKGIKKAIKSGRITLPDGEVVLLKDSIVIFSCESFSSVSRACSPSVRGKYGESERDQDLQDGKGDESESTRPCTTLDLNIASEDDNIDDQSVSDIGILDSVDKQVIFKIQML